MSIEAKQNYILVLEDDLLWGDLVRIYLEAEGLKVEVAISPEEADEITARRSDEGWKLLHYCGDFNLRTGENGCSGLEYGLRLRETISDLGITLITGSVSEPAVQEFALTGEVIDKNALDGKTWDRVESLAQRLREKYFCSED